MTDNTRIIVRVTVGALIIIAFVVAGIASVDRGQPPAAHLVTIDSGEVAVIDLWNETRGTVTGQAHNGETVRLPARRIMPARSRRTRASAAG